MYKVLFLMTVAFFLSLIIIGTKTGDSLAEILAKRFEPQNGVISVYIKED